MSILVSQADLEAFVWASAASHSAAEQSVLLAIATAVSDDIENRIGPVLTQNLDELYEGDGTERLLLQNLPVVTVASVTEDGALLTAGADEDYVAYLAEGRLRRIGANWSQEPQGIEVVYTAGLAATVDDVPTPIQMAVKMWAKIIWDRLMELRTRETGQTQFTGSPGKMPSAVAEFLAPYAHPGIG